MSNIKKTVVINTTEELHKYANRMLDAQITKPLDITTSVHKKSRSLAQNKLFHMHMHEISNHYGETQGDFFGSKVWKKYFKDKFLETITVTIGGKEVNTTKDTSDLKMNEFSELIEKVIMYAADELNCQVTVPNDIYAEAMGK